MNKKALKVHIIERENILYGNYSPLKGVTNQISPIASGDPFPTITAVHESIHRDLTVASEIGFFEMLLSQFLTIKTTTFQISLKRRINEMRSVLKQIITASWMTHESAATYSSIIAELGNRKEELWQYLEILPSTYQEAYSKFSYTFGDCYNNELEGLVKGQIAKNISRAALDVPILTTFPSFKDVKEKKIRDFLIANHPDKRQEEILESINKKKLQNILVKKSITYLEENGMTSLKLQGISITMETFIKLVSKLDLFILEELKNFFPDLVTTDIAIQKSLRKETTGIWNKDWQVYGIEVDYQHFEPEKDSSLETDSLLDNQTSIVPINKSYLLRKYFTPLPLKEVPKYVETIKKVGADLVIFISHFKNSSPIKISDNYDHPANQILFFTYPWQWEGDDRMEVITNSKDENQYMELLALSCSENDLDQLLKYLADVKIVWLISNNNFNKLKASQRNINPRMGWVLVYRYSSSPRQILQVCSEKFASDELGVIFYAKPDERSGDKLLFVLLILEDKRQVHIFPFSFPSIIAALLQEKLNKLPKVNIWDGEKVMSSGLASILADIVLMFFTHDS